MASIRSYSGDREDSTEITEVGKYDKFIKVEEDKLAPGENRSYKNNSVFFTSKTLDCAILKPEEKIESIRNMMEAMDKLIQHEIDIELKEIKLALRNAKRLKYNYYKLDSRLKSSEASSDPS